MSDNENSNLLEQPNKRRRFPRARTTYVWIIGLIVIALSLVTEPDSGFLQKLSWGAGTIATLIILSKGVLYCTLLHYTRKGLIDYFNGEEAWNKACQTSEGAGMYMIGIGIYTLAFAVVIFTAVSR